MTEEIKDKIWYFLAAFLLFIGPVFVAPLFERMVQGLIIGGCWGIIIGMLIGWRHGKKEGIEEAKEHYEWWFRRFKKHKK